jgi:phosphoenolpyruvate-protein kinase (PTS system EI component)
LYDVKDALRRILWHLQPGAAGPGNEQQKMVLVGEEASVADLFSVDHQQLAAVVVEQGGSTSHAAILARTLGIPMVAQVQNLRAAVRAGTRVLVDGDQSLVIVHPLESHWRKFAVPSAAHLAPSETSPPSPPVAAAGERIGPEILANINLVSEVPQAVAYGVSGVGLYRTELLMLSRRGVVSEEQQLRNYRQLLTQLGGRPANIRTFDLRAEKAPPASAGQPEPGSLDWRLVLRSPAVQRVFKQQVRAILRAGIAGPVRILVPLVVSAEQLAWLKMAIAEAAEELRREGLPCAEQVPLGIMIEVPAAVMLVEEWVGQVDFLCLGTNDLLAGAMGVSRDDPVCESICDPLHPGLLRLVQHVITAGRSAGKPVTVCGEIAAHRQGAKLLADMGADALSVAVERIPHVRQALAEWAASRHPATGRS